MFLIFIQESVERYIEQYLSFWAISQEKLDSSVKYRKDLLEEA